MELTATFAEALKLARAARGAQETSRETAALDSLFAANGTSQSLKRVHLRVRRAYARTTENMRATLAQAIDWLGLVQWLKDNWQLVIRIIFFIVPIII